MTHRHIGHGAAPPAAPHVTQRLHSPWRLQRAGLHVADRALQVGRHSSQRSCCIRHVLCMAATKAAPVAQEEGPAAFKLAALEAAWERRIAEASTSGRTTPGERDSSSRAGGSTSRGRTAASRGRGRANDGGSRAAGRGAAAVSRGAASAASTGRRRPGKAPVVTERLAKVPQAVPAPNDDCLLRLRFAWKSVHHGPASRAGDCTGGCGLAAGGGGPRNGGAGASEWGAGPCAAAPGPSQH